MAQVLTHLMVNHERREFVLASQIRTEWLPSTPGVEFVRLADADVVGHISACGVYWLVEKVDRVDNVVSIMLNQSCGGTVRGYIVSFEGSEWRLGPPGSESPSVFDPVQWNPVSNRSDGGCQAHRSASRGRSA
jgi:hypothetical protein